MKYYKTIILVFIVILLNKETIFPCTMITAANDTIVLAGNNEDYSDPNTYTWFIQKNETRQYGCIYFGYGNLLPQGGMNEAGLCFDHFATASNPIYYPFFDRPPIFTSNPWELVMSNCSTVSEVVSILNQHDLSFMKNFQSMFVDKSGDFVIIEGDKIIRKNDFYQVCTNFYHSDPSLGGYPCWRYETAVEMLKDNKENVSIPLFKNILDATHQEGQYPTLYTNIYDLQNGTVYLYYNHFYDEVIKIDLQEGLSRGNRKYNIPPLYSNLIIKSPEDGLLIDSTSATLNWEGEGENYELLYSIDPEFDSFEMIAIEVSDYAKRAIIPFGLILILPFFFVKRNIKNKRIIQSLLTLFIGFLCISCNLDKITSSADQYEIKIDGKSVNVTIHSLLPNTTYYWQVIAENKGPFRSESPIYRFFIASDL